MSTLTTKKEETNFKIDPTQFTMWIFLVSVAMMFAAFTSGYIVRKAQGNWVNFELPTIFVYSCIVVLLSSGTMAFAQFAHKKLNKAMMQVALLLSLIVGGLFVYFQLEGWNQLMDQGIYLVGNPSGSFLYVISGVHVVHFTIGLLAILVALLRSFLLSGAEIKTQKINSVATYWHFVGALWIYLYLFLTNA
ncbi:MAG: cytochrome c oxidase subunit 3 [Bacteroidia bacterium]